MGRIGFPVRRGAQSDAHPSGKHRNAAEEPIRPTAGRVLLYRGVVAFFADAGHRHAKRGYPLGIIIPVK